jgi:hypothetical protein
MHTQAEDVPILTSKQLKVQVFMKRDKVRPHLLLHIATVQQQSYFFITSTLFQPNQLSSSKARQHWLVWRHLQNMPLRTKFKYGDIPVRETFCNQWTHPKEL